MTVTFNQTAGFPNVHVLEYSGLDTTNPLDVTCGSDGQWDDREQRVGDDDVGQ